MATRVQQQPGPYDRVAKGVGAEHATAEMVWTRPCKMEPVSETLSGGIETIGSARRPKALAQLSARKRLTLVYSAADEEHNQAVVLKELLEELA